MPAHIFLIFARLDAFQWVLKRLVVLQWLLGFVFEELLQTGLSTLLISECCLLAKTRGEIDPCVDEPLIPRNIDAMRIPEKPRDAFKLECPEEALHESCARPMTTGVI